MNRILSPFAFLAIAAFIALAAAPSNAASIVKATYSLNGNQVALMVYTGRDGGSDSDRAVYWKLLGKAPEGAYKIKVKPDQPTGKIATLKGDISVSVVIRNQFSMGIAKTQKLILVRDEIGSSKWYIPAKELKRIIALISKKSADNKPEKDSGKR